MGRLIEHYGKLHGHGLSLNLNTWGASFEDQATFSRRHDRQGRVVLVSVSAIGTSLHPQTHGLVHAQLRSSTTAVVVAITAGAWTDTIAGLAQDQVIDRPQPKPTGPQATQRWPTEARLAASLRTSWKLRTDIKGQTGG